MAHGLDQQKPRCSRATGRCCATTRRSPPEGKNPLQLDSKAPTLPLEKYIYNETRYTMLVQSDPAAAKKLAELAQHDVAERWRTYTYMAAMAGIGGNGHGDKGEGQS